MAGKAKEEQSSKAGTYILSDGLVNGYPHWLKKGDGSQAIWFDKVISAWMVGDKKDLGISHGGIHGPYGKDSYPNEIKHGWRYWDNGFQDAGPNDVMFKGIGKFFKLLLHKINSTFFPSQNSIQKLLIKLKFFKSLQNQFSVKFSFFCNFMKNFVPCELFRDIFLFFLQNNWMTSKWDEKDQLQNIN